MQVQRDSLESLRRRFGDFLGDEIDETCVVLYVEGFEVGCGVVIERKVIARECALGKQT